MTPKTDERAEGIFYLRLVGQVFLNDKHLGHAHQSARRRDEIPPNNYFPDRLPWSNLLTDLKRIEGLPIRDGLLPLGHSPLDLAVVDGHACRSAGRKMELLLPTASSVGSKGGGGSAAGSRIGRLLLSFSPDWIRRSLLTGGGFAASRGEDDEAPYLGAPVVY
ncbi:hypothetical protein ACLOJK_029399 [Asimina triloba]